MLSGHQIVVVGAGFYGATIAERAAASGITVLLVDRRHHIGGNAYSERDLETGIEVHRYGAHLFHTSNEEVWNYLNRFTTFTAYRHHVFTVHRGRVFSLPINLGTICQFFERQFSPGEARALIRTQASEVDQRGHRSLEEKAISLIGRPLYEAFIRDYTLKQWQMDPRELPPEIITRLPVRYTYDNRYFNDIYEGLPTDGYTAIFERMIASKLITLRLGVDFFNVRAELNKDQVVVYTGPIDRYFDYCFGELGWRTVEFEWSRPNIGDYQGTAVMNYADANVPWTRIIEFRHFYPEREYGDSKTVIAKEYSRRASRFDEPFYPIDAANDKSAYTRYKQLTRNLRNVHFGGRLGTYRYIDMHQAIGAALRDVNKVIDLVRDSRL